MTDARALAEVALLAVAAGALGVVFVGWCAYPLVLAVRAAHARRGAEGGEAVRVDRADDTSPRVAGCAPADPDPPAVTCVIATREPPPLVARRVADLRAARYPPERLEIVVALDRDAAPPHAEYAAAVGRAARLVRARDAPGKAAALNAGVAIATGECVVLTDSAQRFDPLTIVRLVRSLAAPGVGAVSGRLWMPADDGGGGVLAAFWRYELYLRRLESRVDSIVAVTGAVYAIRRELWPVLRPGTICDDLVVPLRVVRRGYRVAHCEEAHAFDPRRFTPDQEIVRKVRTLTGMVQACAWEPWILVPWRNRVWFQFACHKLVRLATPLLVLVACVALAGWLALQGWLEPLARAFILVGGGTLIVVDLWRPRWSRALLERGSLALRLLLSPLRALRHALRGDWEVWRAPEAPRLERAER